MTGSSDLMKCRIRSLLLICNGYDAFSLEEDGLIETQIRNEYLELGLSNPPEIFKVETTAEALDLLSQGRRFDLVLTMYNVGKISVYDFAKKAKEYAPEMPKKLPDLLAFSSKKVPEHMKPAVINSLFPAFGSLMHNIRFRYIDNVYHEPHFMCGMVGPMAIGKGSINPIIDVITHSTREHDMASRAKLNEWIRQCKTAGANKSKPARPEDAAILLPQPDMTNPALIQLLMDAENEGNRFLYTNIPEVDLLDQCSGSHKKVTKIIRLAYDLSPLGAQRATIDGISGCPTLRWNFNFSCVEQKAIEFFRHSLIEGTFSRIGFSYIQRPKERSGKIPKQGIYDDDFTREMDSYLIRLQAATGDIVCHQANELVDILADEMANLTSLNDDDNFYDLSHRSICIAWLKACVLYVANGYRWSAAIADFMRWSAYYDLWSKYAIFSIHLSAIQNVVDTSQTRKHGPANMLNDLRDDFTFDDLVALRFKRGKTSGGTENLLSQWKSRGYITSDPTINNLYHKTLTSHLSPLTSHL